MTDAWARANGDRLAAEGHARIAGAFYNIAFVAMAFVGVIGGAYSRLGYGGRIATVAGAALATRTLGFAAEAAAAKAPLFNLAQYGVPVLGAAIALAVLFAGPRRTSKVSPTLAVAAAA